MWNGEEYSEVLRNYRPDHLAILPDLVGACSLDDGAGFLRLNASNKIVIDVNSLSGEQREALSEKGVLHRLSSMITNELSFDAVRQQLSALLNEQFTGTDEYVWVDTVFEDNVIYEKGSSLFKNEYTIVDDVVSLKGLPIEVVRTVDFVVKNERNPNMDKKKLVDGLIANASTTWAEDDRETLMSLDEGVLTKMMPVVNEDEPVVDQDAEAAEGDAEEVPAEEAPAEEAVENKKPMTVNQFIDAAPEPIREVLQAGLASHQADKKRLTNVIVANERNKFTEKELMAKKIDELRKLAALSAPTKVENSEPRFDGQGDPYDIVENGGEEPLDIERMSFGEAD